MKIVISKVAALIFCGAMLTTSCQGLVEAVLPSDSSQTNKPAATPAAKNEATVKVGGKEMEVNSLDDIENLLDDSEVLSAIATSTETKPFVIEISSDTQLSTAGGDDVVSVPFVKDSYVALKFDGPVETSAEKPLTLSVDEGNDGETNNVIVSLADAGDGYLAIDMKSSTVDLMCATDKQLSLKQVASATATNTLVIDGGVSIDELIIMKGRYELAGGDVGKVTYLYDPISLLDAEGGKLPAEIKLKANETLSIIPSVSEDYASADDVDLELMVHATEETFADCYLDTSTGHVVIEAYREGQSTIEVWVDGDKATLATVKVVVEGVAEPEVVPVTGIKLSEKEWFMVPGETRTLYATITPENATDKTITWTSSDPSVVTVDANGKVTAMDISSNASAEVTAKANGAASDNADGVVDKIFILVTPPKK